MISSKKLNWKNNIHLLSEKNPAGFKIMRTFCSLLDFIEQKNWQGACHASSSVLATLLKFQGIESTLFVGEAFFDLDSGFYFDHSWVEINNHVYDAAISRTLVNGLSFPPVFNGIDCATKTPTPIVYGKSTDQGLDPIALAILTTPVHQYMKMCPDFEGGLFGVAKTIGKSFGLSPTITSLEKSSMHLQWTKKLTA